MTLALTIGFFKDVQDLGKTIENKVIDMLRKFQRDPNSNGLNVEQLNNAPKNVRSVRIDRAFRAIGVLNGDVLTLVSCGDHEGTYRWMVGKDYNKLAENAMKLTDDPAFLMAGLDEESSTPFHALDNYTKEQLCQLGFTSGQAENLKNIKTQELFNEIKKMIIGEQAQILEFCEAGENFEDILELVESCREEKEIPVNSPVPNGVYVIEDDNSVDEFRKAVKGEIGTWRLFLHPSQERYAFGDFKGSVYICGEAGTGKTVAAVHRAKYLADTLADNEHILVTTFTKNLATDIASMLDDMNIENRKQIEVMNIDSLEAQLFGKTFPNKSIMYDKSANSIWEQLISEYMPGSKYGTDFFIKEWERLIVPGSITTIEGYRKADRTGLGYPMNRIQRDRVWAVIEKFRALVSGDQVEKNLSYKLLSDQLRKQENTKYKHIIADEIQDFSPQMLTLLSALAGTPHENDIYMTGDASQNIYGKKLSFEKCGITIANRRYQLLINYRTTDEISRFALELLGNSKSYDKRTLSLTHAKAPKTIQTDLTDMSTLIPYLEELTITGENICIVTRRSDERDKISKYLNVNGIKNRIVDDKTTGESGINIATISRVKGLEFDNVIIWGLDKWMLEGVSPTFSNDPASSKETENSFRNSAYVAATRARKGLICFVKNH